MFAWYHELTGRERNTFWGCFAGWAVDAMDAQLFSFVLPVLMTTWSMSAAQAGYLATATLLSAAVGGWACGILADRFGRVRVMQFTILWFSLFTFLAGFTQGPGQLMAVRVLQGLGFGGEWAAGAVLMGEIIRPAHRGKAVGCVQSGFGIGWSAAAILAGVVLSQVQHEYAWRVLLWIGVLPGFLVIYLRRNLDEPDIYRASRVAEQKSGIRQPMLAIFHLSQLRITILTSLLAFGVIGVGGAIVNWLPTFMRTVRMLSPGAAGTYVFVITAGSFFGFITSAYLADRLGRRRTFQIFLVCSWLLTMSYMFLPVAGWMLVVLGFPFGFFTIGNYAALGPFFTELFPTAIRATGQSFAYNFGKAAGAAAVALIGILANQIGLGGAIGLVALLGYSAAILATLLLPETRGASLEPGVSVPSTAVPNGHGKLPPSQDMKAPMQHLIRSAVVCLAICSTALFSNTAAAAAPMVKTQAPGYYRLMLGDFEVTVLSDGTNPLPATRLLQGDPRLITDALKRNFLEDLVETSHNSFLVNTGSKLVLVDVGAGTMLGPHTGDLMANHLHTDHVGGLVTGDQRAFPNAIVRTERRETDYWLSDANMSAATEASKRFFVAAGKSLAPYIKAGRLVPFEGDTDLVPGVQAKAAYGHTPGHTAFLVESKGQKLLLWGDVVHVAAVQFDEPSVTIAFDVNGSEAEHERDLAFADATRNGYMIGGAHISFPGLGHVRKDGNHYMYLPLNYSSLK